MKLKLIRFYVFCVLILVSVKSSAQEKDRLSPQDEYKAEIGIDGGGSYYLGDANSQLFNNMQLAYGGFFRYRFDTRLAAKIELTKTSVFGQGFNNNPIYALDLTGEFNFFDLEKNEYKRYSKIFSPYIFVGVGIAIYSDNVTINSEGTLIPSNTTPSIPFGVGMKVKLGKRWNLNAQWTTRLLFADDVENVPELNNSTNLNGSNPFNNDLLSTLTVGISFDIWKKHCDCENSTIHKDRHKFK